MKTWYTSDLHFMHKRIVEFTNRSVETTQELHDEWLIRIWNSQVNPEDTVWHLGDFCFARGYDTVANIVKRLNGAKFFLKGNHCDRAIMQRLRDENLIQWFGDYREVYLKDAQGKKQATCLFHFPVAAWHKQGHGSLHLHGHCHGSFQGQGKSLDVGLDNAYNIYGTHRFFSEENVLEFMQGRDKVVVDHHKNRED